MTLKTECRPVGAGQTLQRAVEQRDVGWAAGWPQRLRVDRETVVLAGDADPAAVEILHRVVGAVVAEFHLEGRRARGQRHDLVTEADAEVGRRLRSTHGSRRSRNRRVRDRPGRC